ncbi:uncharacterized protein LOC105177292 isoform X2 [Sesamum indicum]|uniref:Uncharacterized protein LOC105177292 isoform X2 n=1 Tax=Sesamum indicum TaxID=4182 RepID=A0A6I9UKV2_SESIN|nr:uncharacterized protein LOC105177292 isoform X2 [Sesamum indicum]
MSSNFLASLCCIYIWILIMVFCGSYSGLASSEKLIACAFGSSHGMGTKIQGNAFLRESHSVIDLDGSTSSGARTLYHENQLLRNGQNPDSFTSPMYTNGYLGYDSERVRQTILEHESIFRNQIQELHRLYARQQELMNEIKRRELNKDDMKGEKHRLSTLFAPIPPGDAKRTWNLPHSMADCLPTSGTSSKLFPSFPEDNGVPVLPCTQDIRSLRTCEPWLSKCSVFPNGTYTLGIPADIYHRNLEKRMQERFCKLQGVEIASTNRNHPAAYGDTSLTNPRDGVPDGPTLSRGEVTPNTCSNFNLMTRDFFQNSLDAKNGSSLSILGSRNERSGKEHHSDDHAEKRRFDKHSSVGDFGSGKSLAFPQPLQAEPRNEPSNCPLDMGTSVPRGKRKIFGVEISEENDGPSNVASNISSTLDQKVGPHQENHHVVSFDSPSWISKSYVQNLELGGINGNNGKNKADVESELSSQKSYHSDMNGKWLQGCSSIGSNFVKGQSDNRKCFMNMDDMNLKPAEVLKKNPENFQKFQEVVPQHHTVLADCQSHRENSRGGLPWFLKNSQDSGDPNKGVKRSYFMNLDSLQSCSQKFFGKSEMADGSFQASKQDKEISAPKDVEGGINEINNSISTKKILGFPISNIVQSFKDPNSGDNLSRANCPGICGDSATKAKTDEDVSRNQLETKNLVLQKGLNNYISDLRHHIDLNLSLEEEDAPSAPSVPTAIVKIATTEIDLEVPAVVEFETNTSSPKESKSRKMDMPQGNPGVSYEERDRIAAEAIISILLSGKKNLVDDCVCGPPEVASRDHLKWFAETILSQCGDTPSIYVEVPLNQNGSCKEEESIPDGMDYFEFMTLKLEETKEKYYHYEPAVLNNPSDDEIGNATLSKRSRRGQSRRGRQRKDFQRDILPGLVTLSRLEVTEDLQAFEELLKAEGRTLQSGLSQRSSTRNGRGRKRSAGPTTPITTRALCSTPVQKPICQLEERSLAGWGKKTRRLPRQRCPNAIISFPVKC